MGDDKAKTQRTKLIDEVRRQGKKCFELHKIWDRKNRQKGYADSPPPPPTTMCRSPSSPPPPPPLLSRELKPVGRLEEKVSMVLDIMLKDDENTQTIGIYGPAGVGKTKLLWEIYDRLLTEESGSHDFDEIVWVWVSGIPNIDTIQAQILRGIGFSDHHQWKDMSQEERTTCISQKLSTSKFVLFLDDVEGPLDFLKIGVPLSSLFSWKSKFVLTTRSISDYCFDFRMGYSNPVELTWLSEEEGYELLVQTVGETTLSDHPDIPQLARRITTWCHGLPRAIITVGLSLARKKYDIWKRTEYELNLHGWRSSINPNNFLSQLKFEGRLASDDVPRLEEFLSSWSINEGDKAETCSLTQEGYADSPPPRSMCWSPPPPMWRSPSPPPPLLTRELKPVGRLEEKVTMVLDMMLKDDENAQTIGIYGPAGVGKTTLLREIYGRLLMKSGSHDFDVIVWVWVSGKSNIGNIQGQILKGLGYSDHQWKDMGQYQRATCIFEKLDTSKYVLLLDDIEEPLDLIEIGVPFPEKGWLVLTSRSIHKCIHYGVPYSNLVELNFLSEEEGYELLVETVGETALSSQSDDHPDIPQLARHISTWCHGLPQAIITVGRSLAGKKYDVWERIEYELNPHVSHTIPSDPNNLLSQLTNEGRLANNEVPRLEEILSSFSTEGQGDKPKTDHTKKPGHNLPSQLTEEESVEIEIVSAEAPRLDEDISSMSINEGDEPKTHMKKPKDGCRDFPSEPSKEGSVESEIVIYEVARLDKQISSMSNNEGDEPNTHAKKPKDGRRDFPSQPSKEGNIESEIVSGEVPRLDEKISSLSIEGDKPKTHRKKPNYGYQVVKKKLLSYFNPKKTSSSLPLPRSVSKLVGRFKEKIIEVCDILKTDESTKIIGIHGLAGVGKTTLLKGIHGELMKNSGGSHEFDLILWVGVPNNQNIGTIQGQILRGIGFSDHQWKNVSQDERKMCIFQNLSTFKFVLFLDNVRAPLDFSGIGVPIPLVDQGSYMSKIVFTTRLITNGFSNCFYNGLNASVLKMVEVDCLSQIEGYELFIENVGETTISSHPNIPHLARYIAGFCDGLPLAIVTVGSTLAGKPYEEWKRQKDKFDEYPSHTINMGPRNSLSSLWTFYGYLLTLLDTTMRSCLKYCSLFPEDSAVNCDQLIDYWIGERFIKASGYGENQGYSMIEGLKGIKLMFGEGSCVQTHSRICEFALWMRFKDKHLVNAGECLTKAPRSVEWKEAKRVSLVDNEIEQLSEAPFCPDLSTLLLSKNPLKRIEDGFFQFMPSLRVLDLSWCMMDEIPKDVVSLVGLQYLNLSHTDIARLPIEFMNLTNVRVLDLSYMNKLYAIPRQVLGSLQFLEVLNTFQSFAPVNLIVERSELLVGGKEFVEELHRLNCLDRVGISIKDVQALKILENSRKLQDSMHSLLIRSCKGLTKLCLSYINRREQLRTLEINDCEDLLQIELDQKMLKTASFSFGSRNSCFYFLRYVKIEKCWSLEELTWLFLVPYLQELYIERCMNLKVVIDDHPMVQRSPPMSLTLRSICLGTLPALACFSKISISFPYLEEITVSYCPKLKVFPVESMSDADSLKLIRGQREWWDGLEWENKSIMNPYFKELKL